LLYHGKVTRVRRIIAQEIYITEPVCFVLAYRSRDTYKYLEKHLFSMEATTERPRPGHSYKGSTPKERLAALEQGYLDTGSPGRASDMALIPRTTGRENLRRMGYGPHFRPVRKLDLGKLEELERLLEKRPPLTFTEIGRRLGGINATTIAMVSREIRTTPEALEEARKILREEMAEASS
jgi:hypothetical protein